MEDSKLACEDVVATILPKKSKTCTSCGLPSLTELVIVSKLLTAALGRHEYSAKHPETWNEH